MRAGVVQTGEAGLEHDRNAREDENAERIDQHRQHREFHLARLDLLAEIFRRAADHKTGDENGDNRQHQNAVETGADAARRDAAHQHVEQGHETAERHEGVVHRVDGAAARAGRRRGEQRAHRGAEADLLAFHIAGRRIDADLGQQRISACLGPVSDRDARDEHDHHGDGDRATLSIVEDRTSKGERRARRG